MKHHRTTLDSFFSDRRWVTKAFQEHMGFSISLRKEKDGEWWIEVDGALIDILPKGADTIDATDIAHRWIAAFLSRKEEGSE